MSEGWFLIGAAGMFALIVMGVAYAADRFERALRTEAA